MFSDWVFLEAITSRFNLLPGVCYVSAVDRTRQCCPQVLDNMEEVQNTIALRRKNSSLLPEWRDPRRGPGRHDCRLASPWADGITVDPVAIEKNGLWGVRDAKLVMS